MQSDFLLSSYEYTLPPELIAQEPVHPAHHAKLLVISGVDSEVQREEKTQPQHKNYQNLHFSDLPNLLTNKDVLLLNKTKVFKARIPLKETKILRKSWIEKIIDGEVFVYQLINDQHVEGLVSDDKNFKPGARIFLDGKVQIISKEYTEDGILFGIEGMETIPFLEKYGNMPLPPYINYEKNKEQRYQTDFAEKLWSAAAPTASLHFTKELLEEFKKKGVESYFSTLHVGLGTFKPVFCEDIRKHPIHKETMIIDRELFWKIAEWKMQKKNLIAVGTTMVRLLETLPFVWKLMHTEEKKREDREVQAFWERITKEIDTEVAQKFVNNFSFQEGNSIIDTTLFIYPGFIFRIIDEMITNFHLPKSSLLMLVSSVMGKEETMQIYQYAIEQKYQFYSFGDGMRIRKQKTPINNPW